MGIYTSKVDGRNRVIIPKKVREMLGCKADDIIVFETKEIAVTIYKLDPKPEGINLV